MTPKVRLHLLNMEVSDEDGEEEEEPELSWLLITFAERVEDNL